MKLNKRNKLLFGVGVNDADYNVCKTEKIGGKYRIVWRCPFYMTWTNMLARSYDSNSYKNNPSYLSCSVATEWHLFSVFKAWMETQDWQGKHLDKDLLIPGNKQYGPDTCVFLDPKINGFLIETNSTKNGLPIGVYWHKRDEIYVAQCSSVNGSKRVFLGYYSDPDDAHKAWLSFKVEQAYILANEQTDPKISQALINKYNNYI